jgi:hypothetical protein
LTQRQRPLGDGPIEEQYRVKMQDLARLLDAVFNGPPVDGLPSGRRTTGFVLLVFPFDSHDGRCNYISNGADRKDIVTMMKEQIKRFEGQPELTGRA